MSELQKNNLGENSSVNFGFCSFALFWLQQNQRCYPYSILQAKKK